MTKIKFVNVCRGNYGANDKDGRPIARIRKIDTYLWHARTKGESGHFDTLRDAKAFVRRVWEGK